MIIVRGGRGVIHFIELLQPCLQKRFSFFVFCFSVNALDRNGFRLDFVVCFDPYSYKVKFEVF